MQLKDQQSSPYLQPVLDFARFNSSPKQQSINWKWLAERPKQQNSAKNNKRSRTIAATDEIGEWAKTEVVSKEVTLSKASSHDRQIGRKLEIQNPVDIPEGHTVVLGLQQPNIKSSASNNNINPGSTAAKSSLSIPTKKGFHGKHNVSFYSIRSSLVDVSKLEQKLEDDQEQSDLLWKRRQEMDQKLHRRSLNVLELQQRKQ